MVPPVVLWGDFRRLRPDLAEAGRRLLYQFGVGLGFLGTVRGDGGPRIHPICPLLTDDGLYAFLAPSLKRDDLHRDPRYALHSFPSPQNEDAFYVTGTVRPVEDTQTVAALRAQFLAERKWDSVPPGGRAGRTVRVRDSPLPPHRYDRPRRLEPEARRVALVEQLALDGRRVSRRTAAGRGRHDRRMQRS